jgi:hypothetical protein
MFQVKATSLTSMTYRWFRNGVRINGAVSSTLIIPNAQTNDVGAYYVEVRNLTGAVNSSEAGLTLLAVTNVPLVFRWPGLTNAGFCTHVSGPVLFSYVVESSTDGSNWDSLATIFTESGNISFTDVKADADYRLYRALLPSPVRHQQSSANGNKVQLKADEPGAQSFRHGTAGESKYSISKVLLRLSRESSAPDGYLIFSIGTGLNTSAIPGSTVAISPSAVTNVSGGNSFHFYEIIYPSPIGPFTAGTTYYLNFENTASNGRDFMIEASSGNTYSRGTYYRNGVDDGRDLRFEVWGH